MHQPNVVINSEGDARDGGTGRVEPEGFMRSRGTVCGRWQIVRSISEWITVRYGPFGQRQSAKTPTGQTPGHSTQDADGEGRDLSQQHSGFIF
jgi:hypothetical protein